MEGLAYKIFELPSKLERQIIYEKYKEQGRSVDRTFLDFEFPLKRIFASIVWSLYENWEMIGLQECKDLIRVSSRSVTLPRLIQRPFLPIREYLSSQGIVQKYPSTTNLTWCLFEERKAGGDDDLNPKQVITTILHDFIERQLHLDAVAYHVNMSQEAMLCLLLDTLQTRKVLLNFHCE